MEYMRYTFPEPTKTKPRYEYEFYNLNKLPFERGTVFGATELLHGATEFLPPSLSSTGPSLNMDDLSRISSLSVTDRGTDDGHTYPTTRTSNEGEDEEHAGYDLKPPPPNVSQTNMECLAERFFSIDHLDLILRDPSLNARFKSFLQQYKPQCTAALNDYLHIQKANLAVEYANALVAGSPYNAANIDQRFQDRSRNVVGELLHDALPAFLTHKLTKLVCESLVREITQTSAPVMRELIPSLAEVYCVADPSLQDCPIVYASEEFYRTTQYGKDYAIGKNCRFLQGPRTAVSSVKRLVEAITAGHEVTETILNYRRDGSPFLNLLLIAPLYDNKGTVRYYLGCQVDVSSLIENGRGVESFAQLLAQDRARARDNGAADRTPEAVLGQLGSLLVDDEKDIVLQGRPRSVSGASDHARTPSRAGTNRRVLGIEPSEQIWPPEKLGSSGRLPGVYQNYLLVRPYPSMRITFTSPALRIPGLLQTKFMDRIGGPKHVQEGILDSFIHGTSVTAKVSWLPSAQGNQSTLESKPRWVHCTPMMGSDDRVGVWMVVMVEEEEVTGSLNSRQSANEAPRFTENKLYAEYATREGGDVHSPKSSARSAPSDHRGPHPFSPRSPHPFSPRSPRAYSPERQAADRDAQAFRGF